MANQKRPVKQGDYYINQYGVKLSIKDVERFRRNVNAINKRAERQNKQFAKLERTIDNKKTGQTVGQLMQMGYEPEFAYAKRTANLNQFKDAEQFRNRLKATEKALSPNYISKRVMDYKRNYTKALSENFGDAAKPLINKIRGMKQSEFIRTITANPDQLSIKSIYAQTGYNSSNLYELAEAWGAKKAMAFYEQYIEL